MVVATPGLSEEQLKKAVRALLKHVAKQHAGAKELFEEDELLHLVRNCAQAVAGCKDSAWGLCKKPTTTVALSTACCLRRLLR